MNSTYKNIKYPPQANVEVYSSFKLADGRVVVGARVGSFIGYYELVPIETPKELDKTAAPEYIDGEEQR